MPHHSTHRNYFQRLLWFSFTLAALTCWGSVPAFAACDVLAFRPANLYLDDSSHAVVKDFNNDGKLDVVTNGGGLNTVNVFLGSGAGVFAQPVSYPVGLPSTGLASADFNNDGKLDLAVLNVRPMNIDVSILLGDGMGGFNAPTSYSVLVVTGFNFQHVTPESFAVADFNGDGRPDVAVGFYLSATSIAVLLNNGSGALLAPIITQNQSQFGQGHVTGMVAGDFNADGKNDLITAIDSFNSGLRRIWRWQGNGMGGFSPDGIDTGWPGADPRQVSAGDFNADGKLDVAVAVAGSSSRVLLNNGFVWTTVEMSAVGGYGSAVADFNGDGKVDAIIGPYIELGNGLGGFTVGGTLPYTSEWTTRVYSGDFNGDGKIDVLTVDSGYVRVLRNWCGQLKVRSDYDGDGKADVAVFRPSNGYWYYFRSADGVIITTQWSSLDSLTDVPVPGNYDNDLMTDFAVFSPTNGVWYILHSRDGSVRGQPWGQSGDKPVPADYDGDGRTDIAVYRPSTGVWYVIRSSDNTLFAQSFGVSEDKPIPADYDGDGKADVAVYRPSVGSWYISRSSDNAVIHYHWGLSTDIPVPADYDGDGRAEIAVFRQSDGTWITRRQDGSADFYPSNMPGAAVLPQPADYDGGGFDRRVGWRPFDGRWWDGLPFSISFHVNFGSGAPADIPVSSPAALNQ
jgi:hypothetical protein